MIKPELLWFSASLLVYLIFNQLQKRIHQPLIKALMNPLLWSIASLLLILNITNTDYQTYYSGGRYVDIWLVPATIALAIKLHKNFELLKRYFRQIILTIFVGILIHTMSMIVLFLLFNISYPLAASLFPKTITTALAIEMTASLGGVTALTIIFVIVAGLLGSIIGPFIFKLFDINNPIAQGVSLGFSAHAIGTSKAIELGEVQGAVSSVTMVLTGIIMVLMGPVVEVLLHLVIQ